MSPMISRILTYAQPKNVMESYKNELEAFVANSKGTTTGVVLACMLHAAALVLYLKLFQGRNPPNLFEDYLILVFPMLLTTTVLVEGYQHCRLLVHRVHSKSLHSVGFKGAE